MHTRDNGNIPSKTAKIIKGDITYQHIAYTEFFLHLYLQFYYRIKYFKLKKVGHVTLITSPLRSIIIHWIVLPLVPPFSLYLQFIVVGW